MSIQTPLPSIEMIMRGIKIANIMKDSFPILIVFIILVTLLVTRRHSQKDTQVTTMHKPTLNSKASILVTVGHIVSTP